MLLFLNCLVREMILMRHFKNKPFIAFGQRIEKSRSGIAFKLKSMNMTVAELTFQIRHYDELALKTYIRKLKW